MIDNTYATDGHSEGLFAAGVNGIAVTQCVFDHDGWNTSISGAGQTQYNHDIYMSFDNTGVSITQSIPGRGVVQRDHGPVRRGTWTTTCSSTTHRPARSGVANVSYSTTGGVTGSLLRNVVVGTTALASTPWGEGFEIGNTKPGAGVTVANNVFTADVQKAQPAIYITEGTTTLNPAVCVGDNDITIQNNVIKRVPVLPGPWTDG